MATTPGPRYGLLLASLAVAALTVGVAVAVTPWALWVLPIALIIGICAWKGMTLTQTWERIGDESGEDPGRGPAGLGF
jgi:hypothetical protein